MKMKKRRRLILLLGTLAIALVILVTNIGNEKPQDVVATEVPNPNYYEGYANDDLKDGVYTSTNPGFVGSITVKMTVKNGRITGFEITEHNETSQISKKAMTDLPYKVLQDQSAKVDAVSGATSTSKGIIQGARDCIRQAGGNPDDY